MKKVKKILKVLLISILLLWNKVAYATTAQEGALKQIGNLKYICIGAGVILILLVLWISYKSDRTEENKGNQLEDDDEEETEIETVDEQNYTSFEIDQDNQEIEMSHDLNDNFYE